MENHSCLSAKELIQQIESCSLNPKLFTHEAHLRLAWLNIKNHGIEKAIELTQKQLKNYVCALGAIDKYNTTLTIAATKAVYHFMLKSEANTFEEFMKECPRLKTDFRKLIESHYSLDIFNSELAKQQYLEPDLCEFD